MNPDYKEIGKNIRLMRIRHGISQRERPLVLLHT